MAASIGALAHLDALEIVGAFLFAGFGFGAIALLLGSAATGFRYLALSLGTSVASVILIGSLLAEFKRWSAGPSVFWILSGACVGIHVFVLGDELLKIISRRRATDQPRDTGPPSGSGSHEQTTALLGSRPRIRMLFPILGFGICVGSAISRTSVDPTEFGVFHSLPPYWFIGIAILVLSVAANFRNADAPLAIGVILTSLALTLTPAIIYNEPRFSWTEKHVGVTAYILAHGSLNPHIDIYQAWPGFFAGMAWISHTVGLTNLFALARWWPAWCDLASLIALVYLASSVGLARNRAWLAGFIFAVGNTIGQDYYSPQSVALLMALVAFGAVYRAVEPRASDQGGEWLVLGVVSLALAITHQLTPYILFGALIILAVFRRLPGRRWTAPAVVLIPSAVWAITHLSAIVPYFNIDQLGDIAANVQTTGARNKGVRDTLIIHLSTAGILGSALLVGLVSLLGFLAIPGRLKWVLALCALSPAGLLAFSNYGNEGLLRVYLFSLPWLAIIAAHVHVRRSNIAIVAIVPGSVLLLASYLLGDMALDYINVVRPGDLAAARYFELNEPSGSVLITIGTGYVPTKSTSRYPDFSFYTYNIIELHGNSTGSIAQAALRFTKYLTPAAEGKIRQKGSSTTPTFYALLTQQSAADDATVEDVSVSSYAEFGLDLERSHSWRVVYRTTTASLLELILLPH